jgi:hypothetical protein
MVHGLDAPLAGWVLLPLFPGMDFPGKGGNITRGSIEVFPPIYFFPGGKSRLPANLVFSWQEPSGTLSLA